MRNPFHRYSKYALVFFVFILSLSVIHFLLSLPEAKINQAKAVPDEEIILLDRAHPQIRAAMAAQDRHTPGLMAIPDVVGTATGLTEDGRPAILVFTKKIMGAGVVPESLEGMPVVLKVTGEIFAMKRPSTVNKIDPTARFPRPVPIGVSTGNENECSAGTIGARVIQGSKVYALSNYHVYALENNAPLGSEVLQPGLYDTSCSFASENVIGTLADFEPIIFNNADCDPYVNPTSCNKVDAAIASSSTDDLSNATPSNGYGKPGSATVLATINQAVQKYGRTTSLTKGWIVGINATVDVTYDSGTARFVEQIVVRSLKPFIMPGDSGSLLVTDPKRNPVGLLFAGDASGKLAIANPIDDVLESFGVGIDGE